MSDEQGKKRSGAQAKFWKVAGGLVVAAVIVFFVMSLIRRPAGFGGLAVGQPAPPIEAAGWLNGPGPKDSDLTGQVVVVNAWASWCVVCRQKAPQYVKVVEKYQPKGAVFIGLSGESVEQVPAMERYLNAAHIKWPNGYGAAKPLMTLNAEWIPMVWVIGRDGKIAWNEAQGTSLEAGIEAALAAKPAG